MNLKYYEINTRFKYPFTISKGTKTHQPALIVELEFMGLKGYGEAPEIAYYQIPVSKMIEDIQAKKKLIEQFALTDPERYWHYLHHLLPANPFLVCALDMACWDLFGKLKRKSCAEMWGIQKEKLPLTDYTIGIDTISEMVRKVEEKPWPVYKIKLGTNQDIEIINELRKHTNSVFRVDANAAWTVDEALAKMEVFKDLNVELIEQPLAKDDWEGMKILFEKSSIPLFADESCVKEADVDKCAGYFHGVNIKLTKCSGPTPARRMIKRARELNMKVMLGTMNETSIGSAALAQLAGAVDYLDMDGTLLLESDVATSVKIEMGEVALGEGYGLGISHVHFTQ
ncbi:MAG: dipeptide epimerase [Ginsengibacter sp.]